MKLNSSGDSGFLSSGDSSVNGDTLSGKFSAFNSSTTSGTGTTIGWGDKSIWGAPLSPTTNGGTNTVSSVSSNKDIWSADHTSSSNSLWDNKSTAGTDASSTNQEWLGSIWMIPQTPQTGKTGTGVPQQIWDAPNCYQSFKNDIHTDPTAGTFQLLRPHDLGNNMWNSSPAAAAMSGLKLSEPIKESVNSLWAAPTPSSYNNYKVNSNPNAVLTNNNNNRRSGSNHPPPAPVSGVSFAAPQLMPAPALQAPPLQAPVVPQPPMRQMSTGSNLYNGNVNQNLNCNVKPTNNGNNMLDTTGILSHHNNLSHHNMSQQMQQQQQQAQQNACLQLFSDDFLNYFNNMVN